MAWTAPIQHAAGDVLPASDWNTYVANNEIALENSLQVFGLGLATAGTNLALGAPNTKIQAISAVLTPTSTGTFSGSWPAVFPNAVACAVECQGDTTNLLGVVSLSNANTNGTVFAGTIWNVNTNVAITVAFRVNVIGIGS